MRCRLILLISEHPIQQGIRKGGVRIFGHGRTERTDRMAYSRKWIYFGPTDGLGDILCLFGVNLDQTLKRDRSFESLTS